MPRLTINDIREVENTLESCKQDRDTFHSICIYGTVGESYEALIGILEAGLVSVDIAEGLAEALSHIGYEGIHGREVKIKRYPDKNLTKGKLERLGELQISLDAKRKPEGIATDWKLLSQVQTLWYNCCVEYDIICQLVDDLIEHYEREVDPVAWEQAFPVIWEETPGATHDL
jgi:hypothetical protein